MLIAERLSARQLILQRRPWSRLLFVYIYIYIYIYIYWGDTCIWAGEVCTRRR